MSRTIIAPIVGVIALILSNVFKVEISEELQNNIIDAILLVYIAITGVIAALRIAQKKKKE
jgi:hypothetical protein